MVSVVIPTINGREEDLDRCKLTYNATTVGWEIELIVVPNLPACGMAWQVGAEQATGDHIHYTADDIEPKLGWLEAAVAAIDQGVVPAPRILRPDGSLESCVKWEVDGVDGDVPDICRIPFMSRAMWDEFEPMIPLHYYTDNWFTHCARRAGYAVETRTQYAFVHHRPPTLRPGEQGRMVNDQRAYERYLQEEQT